jgi:hypothetical protein
MSDTFDSIEGRPIFWTSKDGIVHSCEGAEVHSGVRLLWTLCERDVPGGAAFHPGDHDRVTCEKCLSVVNIREEEAAQRRHDNSQFGVGA